jgi:hypothetical protein
MNKYNDLNKELDKAVTGAKSDLANMHKVADEAGRISKTAQNAALIITDIDRQFEEKTNLTKTDITFLFLAAALQVGRQILLPNDSFRITADEGDKIIKGPAEKIIKNKTWQDILLGSVPYDAVNRVAGFAESTGLSGFTHRYKTLGHDPVLGWIFGPMNIISDSLTKSNFAETYAIENMLIAGLYPGGTMGAVNDAATQIIDGFNGDDIEKKLLLPAAVIKQAIHFGADYFTKQGLPVPLIGSFGTIGENISKELLTKLKINIYSITRAIAVATIINTIIEIIHKLFYREETDGAQSLYEVRTRKIITYSNILASGINIIQVAVRTYIGDDKALKSLDIGGFIVTLYRIATDYQFIKKIKQEFLEKEFYNAVYGEEYDF